MSKQYFTCILTVVLCLTNALFAQVTTIPITAVSFPKEVLPIEAGKIDFWAKLSGYTGPIDYGGRITPHFFELTPGVTQDEPTNYTYIAGFNSNDGMSNGGLIGVVGHSFHTGTGYFGYWTYEDVLGQGKVSDWHHYVIQWNKNGIPGVADGQQKVAIFIDGVLNSARWAVADGTQGTFPPLVSYPTLNLITTQWPGAFPGEVAMDEFKIYDGNGKLILYNTLGSPSEIEHSDVGLNGSFNGGGNAHFVPGISGYAVMATPVFGRGTTDSILADRAIIYLDSSIRESSIHIMSFFTVNGKSLSLPVDGSSGSLTFQTNATNFTVSSNGTITAVAPGTGEVQIKYKDFTCAVSVVVDDNFAQATKAPTSITFGSIGDKKYSTSPIVLQAVSSSGDPVRYTIVEGPARVQDNLLYALGTGKVTIKAFLPENAYYQAAPDVQQSFAILKGDQQIKFDSVTDQSISNLSVPLNAIASSLLPIGFSILSGPATVSGNTVMFTGRGTVIVQAMQSGNELYNPAVPVNDTFNVLLSSVTCLSNITTIAPSCDKKVTISWKEPNDTFPASFQAPEQLDPARGTFAYMGALDGHGYYRSNSTYTWPVARAIAKYIGTTGVNGHVVTINRAAENNFIYNQIKGTGYSPWIGLYNTGKPGRFKWLNGESLRYTNWAPGEPNNVGGDGNQVLEPYVRLLDGYGTWNDQRDDNVPFIAEFEKPLIRYKQISGPKNGSERKVGTYQICYQRTNLITEGKDTCCFSVTITCNTTIVNNSISSSAIESLTNDGKGLHVLASPNPSKTYFRLKILSGDSQKMVSIKVADITGKIIEVKNSFYPNQTLDIGRNLRPGVYFIQVTQGKTTIVEKIIKQ